MPDLYLAPLENLTLATVSIDTECLLILAHNPEIAELAIKISTPEPTHPRFFDYPPGATLVLSYSNNSSSARFVDFVTPDDLPE